MVEVFYDWGIAGQVWVSEYVKHGVKYPAIVSVRIYCVCL